MSCNIYTVHRFTKKRPSTESFRLFTPSLSMHAFAEGNSSEVRGDAGDVAAVSYLLGAG